MTFKRFFALLFILSLSVFLFFQFYHQPEPITQVDKKTQVHQKSHTPSSSFSIETDFLGESDFVVLVSLLTSIFSFFGFTISTYFSFKGHRRDEELFDLQREKERLEMEKIQAEIQALSRS